MTKSEKLKRLVPDALVRVYGGVMSLNKEGGCVVLDGEVCRVSSTVSAGHLSVAGLSGQKFMAHINQVRLMKRDKLPTPNEIGPNTGPRRETMLSIGSEVQRARTKHPGSRHLLAALFEEVGELAKTLLENEPRNRIEEEAMQVACVAIRIMEEGDEDFDLMEDPDGN